MQTKAEIKARQQRYYQRKRAEAAQNDIDVTGMVRVCSCCSVEKPLSVFRKNPTSKLGRAGQCDDCIKEKRRARAPQRRARRLELSNCKTGNSESIQSRMFKRAKSRAKTKKLPFNIELDDIVIPERCPIFGCELTVRGGEFNEYSPSLDRIDNSRGYVKGNVAVISNLANSMKSNKDLALFERMVSYMKTSQVG